MEIIETVDGKWIVLVNGFQWGKGPYDASGCSAEQWETKREAQEAFNQRKEP